MLIDSQGPIRVSGGLDAAGELDKLVKGQRSWPWHFAADGPNRGPRPYVLTDDLTEDHEHDHAGNPLRTDGKVSSPAFSVPSPIPILADETAGTPRCCRDGP